MASIKHNKGPIGGFSRTNKKNDRSDEIEGAFDFLAKVEMGEGEKASFGAGLPDISKFDDFLAVYADMPLKDFMNLSPEAKGAYVQKLSFDPTSARYFDQFMDKEKRPQNDHYKADNFTLTHEQVESFKKNGFVVVPQDGTWAGGYYKIYNNDLPVLVTADSILHAFHMSYDKILKDFETYYCANALKKILESMISEIGKVIDKFTADPFKQCLHDADFFITVALNLLNGEGFYRRGSADDPYLNNEAKRPRIGETRNPRDWYNKKETKEEQIGSILGNDDLVENALKACIKEEQLTVSLFGKERVVDFTHFKPRGHYSTSAELRQYFRAFTWLAKIDLIVAGEGSNLRQLGAAVVLHMLLTNNENAIKTFREYNKSIEALVGPPNSMDFNQLDLLLNSTFKLKSHAELNSEEALSILLYQLELTDFGKKAYNNGDFRSFTLIGQRFTIDSWAQSKVVTSDGNGTHKVLWNSQVVKRYRMSAVEVAFSVFGNDDSASIIHSRIADTSGENKFRDGLNYHPYLMAARKTIDDIPEESWTSSILSYWLNALRMLSKPMDSRFPQAMRTQAYAMKNTNTQLASWAQLRHDNLLYVEQFGRMVLGCDYPEGYVEPFVDFWKAMENMCVAAASAMEIALPPKPTNNRNSGNRQADFFNTFARHVRVLGEISQRELDQQPLTDQQTLFLKTIVEQRRIGSGGQREWTGWYPGLFYGGESDVDSADLIVADVFTDPPSDYDPGCVLHVGLGLPNRMLMAVDSGKDTCVYAGLSFNYHEFEMPGLKRLGDEDWKKMNKDGATPPHPQWTSNYFVQN